jgi:hypothetical protein
MRRRAGALCTDQAKALPPRVATIGSCCKQPAHLAAYALDAPSSARSSSKARTGSTAPARSMACRLVLRRCLGSSHLTTWIIEKRKLAAKFLHF